MKISELKQAMRNFNSKHEIERKVSTKYKEDGTLIEMKGKVVLANSCYNKEYPVELRTYTFSNYNKALTSSDLGYSIFAYCEADDSLERIENLPDQSVEVAEIIETIE
jgi:hypothetical protein